MPAATPAVADDQNPLSTQQKAGASHKTIHYRLAYTHCVLQQLFEGGVVNHDHGKTDLVARIVDEQTPGTSFFVGTQGNPVSLLSL